MSDEKYVLATGEDAEHRLKIVNSVHGADSEDFLLRAGLRRGMKVADIGSGVGIMSCWIAEQIGTTGELWGVDISMAQAEQGRQRAQCAGLHWTHFQQGAADKTGLEYGAFDLVYSRFVLMHVQNPVAALEEMVRLLKPGGILAVEDGDFHSLFCYPYSEAYDRCMQLYRAIGERHGEDFAIGQKLFHLVSGLGLENVTVSLAQPIFTSGDAKRLPEWTLVEAAKELIAAGLATQDEIDRTAAELARLADDPTVVFGMARMMQVRGTKPLA
jgi:ubiquinone/menaquinone biosynthesis C-methylase UbiE